MKVSVFGAGYVGLVTAVGMADMGYPVLCMDQDQDKLDQLCSGKVPFFEPGIEPLMMREINSGRLRFTRSEKEAVEFGDYIFICVGTPPGLDGSADTSAVFNVANSVGSFMTQDKIVVVKSTVPVGTSKKVAEQVGRQISQRELDLEVHVVSNPEFLKEGTALADFARPERIIVGANSSKAFEAMRVLYEPFQKREHVLLEMDQNSSELTKYAANAFLASRISLMNEISLISERLGADIEQVRKGVGSDSRIGTAFLYAGCGYGGSCFPKDVQALIHTARSVAVEPILLSAIEMVNETQKDLLFQKISQYFGHCLKGKTVAVWGVTFKPETDDIRNSPSISLIEKLASAGVFVHVYDPVGLPNARRVLSSLSSVSSFGEKYKALERADALALVTEWKEFRAPDLDELRAGLERPVIFDGRNQWEPSKMAREGFEYYSVGRQPVKTRV